jgi:hypothetical protein
VNDLVKAWLATPLYLSGAWALLISYQLFTQTALETVINLINLYWPSLATQLSSRLDMIVFIYAFTWVFVLTSAMPSVVLGNKRSILLQYFAVLVLTLSSLFVVDFLASYGINVESIFSLAGLFKNPYFAILYLAAPYLLMISIDFWRSSS